VKLNIGQVAHEAQDRYPDGESGQLVALGLEREQRLLQRLLGVFGRGVALEVCGGELGEDILVKVFVKHRPWNAVDNEFALELLLVRQDSGEHFVDEVCVVLDVVVHVGVADEVAFAVDFFALA